MQQPKRNDSRSNADSESVGIGIVSAVAGASSSTIPPPRKWSVLAPPALRQFAFLVVFYFVIVSIERGYYLFDYVSYPICPSTTIESCDNYSTSNEDDTPHLEYDTGNASITMHFEPRIPFDPWNDIEYQSVAKEKENLGNSEDDNDDFSSVRCTSAGPENAHQENELTYPIPFPNFHSRTCWYRNLLYNIKDQTFHYRASPEETKAWSIAKDENLQSFYVELQMQRNVFMQGTSYGLETLRHLRKNGELRPWQPVWHEFHSDPDTRDFFAKAGISKLLLTMKEMGTGADRASDARERVRSREPYFVNYFPTQSFNIGHFIWDDAYAIFTMLDNFDLNHDERVLPIPFVLEYLNGTADPYWRCSIETPHGRYLNSCTRAWQKFVPGLLNMATVCGDILRSRNWLTGPNAFVMDQKHCGPNAYMAPHKNNTLPTNDTYVILPNFIIGMGRTGYSGCKGDCSIGSGSRLYRFRQHLFRTIFGWQKGNEIMSAPPYGYITISLPVGSSRSDSVNPFHREIEATQRSYEGDVVKVVDMANMTFQEQAYLMHHTAVLLTNQGGGSSTSMFLPKGATQLNFFYPWKFRGAVYTHRMDMNIYKPIAYFETIYIGKDDWPRINRTLSIIDFQIAKMATSYPHLACRRLRKRNVSPSSLRGT